MKTYIPCQLLSKTLALVLLPALLLAGIALQSQAGVALRLAYGITGSPSIPGAYITNLTSNALFPNSPDQLDVLTAGLAIPADVAGGYGSLVQGFVEAPQTGQYTFWVQAVCTGELWLSPSEDPAGKVLIAVNGDMWMYGQGPNDWYYSPSQQSAPISLVRGQKYYFELLQKEDNNSNDDSGAVAWLLPDGTFQGPIPSTHLWPFPVDLGNPYPAQSKAPQVLSSYNGLPVDTLPSTITVFDNGGTTLDLTVTVEASQPATVQWYSNGLAIPNANLLTYHIPTIAPALNGAVYSVTITNALGGDSASATLSVQADTTAPTLVDALNLGNLAGDVAVVFSKPVDLATATAAANYAISPSVSINGARMGASQDTVLLQTAGLLVGTPYTVTVNNVRDRASTPNTIAANSSWPIEQYLAAWWRLDETAGTTVADSSGNGLNGTLVKDAYPDYAGKVLRNVKFEGANGGYVALPAGFSDFSTNGMTVSLWAYGTAEGVPVDYARFIDFANGPANDNILFCRMWIANQVSFEVYRGGTSGGAVNAPDGLLLTNQWQHWAATLDPSGNVVIYMNGQPVVTGTTGVPNVVTRNNCYLGLSNWPADGHYAGEMDDVRIYNRVLAPAAIGALAGGGGSDDINASLPVVSAVATVATTALKTTPPGVFTITRTGATTAALTVQYSLGGTATNGVAYNALPGSVVIPAGTNAAPVLVTPKDFAFSDILQTVVLRVAGAAAYTVAVADSDTVTILNNDSPSRAIEVLADNGTGSTTVDVWFSGGVAAPSATSLTNYTLINAPGVTIANATVGNHNLRVVLGLSGPVPVGAQLGVKGANVLASTNAIRQRLTPVNLVADRYDSPTTRAACCALAADGIVDNVNNGGGFDTWSGAGTEFAGLIYDHGQDFEAIKVDLGCQFGDGGSWAVQPKVFILKNPVDSNQTRPETDPRDWVAVPAVLISSSRFQAAMDSSPSPATPIVFDLSGLTADQRNGYGWAVGGVPGSGSAHFISISELRAYGTTGAALAWFTQPTNATVTAGQRAKFSVSVESIIPLDLVAFQWYKNGSPIADGTASAYITPPTSFPTDDSASYVVDVTPTTNGIPFTITSQPAILTVLARTNPPVLAATYDPSNLVVEVWFNGSTDPGSSQTAQNYTLSDPSVTISSATQEGQGCGVVLALSGAMNASNPTLTVTNVLDLEGNSMPNQTIAVLPLVPYPTNVVANAYQQGRVWAFTNSTDGVVINDANVTTWTTFDGNFDGRSDFVGLGYSQPQVFGVVKVDLGYQFGDGGDWSAQPKVFILKHPVDTNQREPETDPADWVAVPASLVSGSMFDLSIDQPANTTPLVNSPIVFDLSHLPLAQRTGWGWAIGGVPGNAITGAQFVSIAEARAFGVPISTLSSLAGAPQILQDVTPSSALLLAGYPFTLSVPLVVGSTPLHYQWQKNGVNLGDDARLTGSQSATLNFATTALGDSGNYRLIVTNTLGSATSSIAPVTVGSSITFNGDGTGWTLTRTPSSTANFPITSNVLTLTYGMYYEARSCFLNYPVPIDAFTASYTYQDVSAFGADAVVFVLQNSPMGPTALGGTGGWLGFDNAGIVPSVGLEMDIYFDGMAFRTNGLTGTPYPSTSPVDLTSGHPINFTVSYNGATLFVTMTDTVANTSFSTKYTNDLAAVLGAHTAYVGFTGAAGGLTSFQQISNFTFANQAIVQPPLSVRTAPGNTVLLSWPQSAAGFTLQQNSALGSPGWTPVPGTPALIGGQYQLSVQATNHQEFYRLQQ